MTEISEPLLRIDTVANLPRYPSVVQRRDAPVWPRKGSQHICGGLGRRRLCSFLQRLPGFGSNRASACLQTLSGTGWRDWVAATIADRW